MKILPRNINGFRTGFTLIEMIIVLLIILAFVGMSLPFFQNLSASSGLKAAEAGIGTLLRTARSYAVSRNDNYEALFDTSTTPNTYSIRQSIAPAIPIDKTYLLPAGVTFTAPATIRFNANGGLSGDSPDTSVTITSKGVNKQVTVETVTGAVTMP